MWRIDELAGLTHDFAFAFLQIGGGGLGMDMYV